MLASIFNFVTSVCAMLTVAVYRGWIIVHFWAWFIMSTFAVDALSIPVALGISVFITMLTQGVAMTTREQQPQPRRTAVEVFFAGIARHTVFFAVGYVISRFV